MRRIVVLAAALAAAALPARAGDAGRFEPARAIVEISHAGDHMKALMPTFVGQMRQMLQAQGDVDARRTDAFLGRFQKRFEEGIPAFTDLVAEVCARVHGGRSRDPPRLLPHAHRPAPARQAGAHPQGMAQVGARWGQSIAQEVIAEQAKERKEEGAPKL